MAVEFEFATAQRIIFGAGRCEKEAAGLAADLGRQPLLVTGRSLQRAEPLLAALRKLGREPVVLSVEREPDLDTVRLGVLAARESRCDCAIGVGGGAVLDTAKAVAALVPNPGDVLDYLEVVGKGNTLPNPGLPVMAIPTTAGTGSEVTRNSVIVVPEHRTKVSLRSPYLLPKIALVDPVLTYELPARLTASTGLDALAQLIEAFVSVRANPLVDGICREGITRAARSLRRAVESPRDPQAREDMALASLFGGLALANAGLGAVHGLAGPLGGMIAAPHGELCGALLPAVMATNISALSQRDPKNAALDRYREVARLLTGNASATPQAAVEWVHELAEELQVPDLAAQGFRINLLPELLEKAKCASSMQGNPIMLTDAELTATIGAAM
ncbi:MAG: iron-containing alcohol dehydrogenase [Thermoleophilia bacterium]|nr:iron-containing alcohol dehydrogenase [Thermoleophilia bacterium]